MAKKLGKCINFGYCDVADEKKVVEVQDGQDFVCPNPECGKPLYPVKKTNSATSLPWKKILIVALPIILILAAIGIWGWPGGGQKQNCTGWECDGQYIIPHDTPVALFGQQYAFKKYDTIDVRSGKVKKHPYVDLASSPPLSPSKSICQGDTVNHFSGDLAFNYITTDITGHEGKVKAIIEIGSKRFDYYIIRRNKQGGWVKLRYSQENKESKARGENIFRESDYENWKRGLTDYINEINDFSREYGGITKRDIHFVMSSGALEKQSANENANRLAKQGWVVNRVETPLAEASFVYKCVLDNPNATIRELRERAFVVDIGSGNTKVAWGMGANQREKLIGADYRNEYKGSDVNDTTVYNSIVKRLSGLIPRQYTGTCIIIGGSPYQLSRLNPSTGRYKQLRSPNTYCPNDIYSDPKDAEKKEWLRGGINIYKAIADATGCTNFVFDGDSNLGIGYLVSRCGY